MGDQLGQTITGDIQLNRIIGHHGPECLNCPGRPARCPARSGTFGWLLPCGVLDPATGTKSAVKARG